jgi:hypothetical protein
MLLTFHVFDDQPTWAPLERLRELASQRPDLSAPEVESYMYMGAVVTEDRSVTIHLYKHQLTRHYLNVDEAGHAYRYAGSDDDEFVSCWYEPLPDLASAIEHAQGEAEWMRSGSWHGPDAA